MVQEHSISFHEGSKMKVSAYLRGGLGNQMFQYATARRYGIKNNMDVILDDTFYKNEYRKYPYPLTITNYDISASVDHNPDEFVPINEPHYHYWEIPDIKNKNVRLNGYFQSEKHFYGMRDILCNEFKPKIITPRIKEYLSHFLQYKYIYVIAIHIRRGERIVEDEAKKTHGVLPWSYYEDAVKTFESLIDHENRVFVIFSDDMDYARSKCYTLPGKVLYVEPGPDWEDLYLFSKCNYAVIANSSFSWWGAWLMPNKSKIIITPDMWVKNQQIITRDVIPEKWVKIYTKLI